MPKALPSARLALLSGLIAVAAAAHAQSVGGLAVAGVATANPDDVVYDSKSFNNNTPATYNTPTAYNVSVSRGGGRNAHGFISGQMGILRASSFAEYPHDGVNKAAQEHTQLNAADSLTVTAPGLATGTPVTVRFLYHLSGTFSTPVFEVGGAYSASVAAYLQANGPGGVGQFTLRYENVGGAAPYDLVGALDAKVGDKIDIAYGLDTFAYITGGATVAGSASVDFSNTAIAYAYSGTPGVTLVAASGHDYAPVPEPAPLAALSLGLLAFRRRRGSRRAVSCPDARPSA